MCTYSNLLREINKFFEEKIETASSFGVESSKIIIDPGIGFAKDATRTTPPQVHQIFKDTFKADPCRSIQKGIHRQEQLTAMILPGDLKGHWRSHLCAWSGVDIMKYMTQRKTKKQ